MKLKTTFLLCFMLLSAIAFSQTDAPASVKRQNPQFYGDVITDNVAVHRIVIPNENEKLEPTQIYVMQAIPGKGVIQYKKDLISGIMSDEKVIAVTNAPIDGYTKLDGKEINHVKQHESLFFGWNPIGKQEPIKFFSYPDFPKYAHLYRNVVQGRSLGLITPRPVYASISAIGIDRYNNLVFVHSRTPNTTVQFAALIQQVMPGTTNMMITSLGSSSSFAFRGADGIPYYSNPTAARTSFLSIGQ